MFCSNCGKQNPDNAKFCASCGASFTNTSGPQYAPPPPQPQYTPPPQYGAPPAQQTIINMAPPPAFPGMQAAMGVSPKSKTTAALLAFFLGTLGIHRFYTGKTGTAVVMLILSIIGYIGLLFVFGIFVIWAVEIWAFIDFIIILMGKFKDKNGLLITK
jgi:TM2 domain-containing membrane protein YozV